MQVKGQVPNNIQTIIKTRGDQDYSIWLNSLSPEAQKIFQSEILITSWHDYEPACVEPLQKMCDLFYNGDSKGSLEFGKSAMTLSLKGIYSIFVKFGSPHFIIKKASMVFATFFKPAKTETIQLEEKLVALRITEFPGITRVVEKYIEGAIQVAAEMTGCKNVKIDITKSLTNNDPFTEYMISWE